MALSNDLINIKSAGTSRAEFDRSVIQTEYITGIDNMRLVPGFARRGVFNRPIKITSASQFASIFGNIDRELEKKGCYFHRTVLQALNAGPVLALNLHAYSGLSDKAKVVYYGDEKMEDEIEANFNNVFDTTLFFEPSKDNFSQFIKEGGYPKGMYFANTSTDPVTIFVVKNKETEPGMKQYRVSVETWYGSSYPETVQEFLDANPDFDPNDHYMSEFFYTVYAFRGDWTVKIPTKLKTFLNTPKNKCSAVKKDGKWVITLTDNYKVLDQLGDIQGVTLLGKWTGVTIPETQNKLGQNITLSKLVNDDVYTTNILASVPEIMYFQNKGSKTVKGSEYNDISESLTQYTKDGICYCSNKAALLSSGNVQQVALTYNDDTKKTIPGLTSEEEPVIITDQTVEGEKVTFKLDDSSTDAYTLYYEETESALMSQLLVMDFNDGMKVYTTTKTDLATGEDVPVKYSDAVKFFIDNKSVLPIARVIKTVKSETGEDGETTETTVHTVEFLCNSQDTFVKVLFKSLFESKLNLTYNGTETQYNTALTNDQIAAIKADLENSTVYKNYSDLEINSIIAGCLASWDNAIEQYVIDSEFSNEFLLEENYLYEIALPTGEDLTEATDEDIVTLYYNVPKVEPQTLTELPTGVVPDGTTETQNLLLNTLRDHESLVTAPEYGEDSVNYKFSGLSDVGKTNLYRTLVDRQYVQWRYLVDSFGLGVEPSCKSVYSLLCKKRMSAFAIANYPSTENILNSAELASVIDERTLGIDYSKLATMIKANDVIGMPREDEGASFIGFYYPYVQLYDLGDYKNLPPAGLVSNLFIQKYKNNTIHKPTAGTTRGVLAGVKGPETGLIKEDRNYLEPTGINSIIFEQGVGTEVYGNKTAKQTPVSSLSSINCRETCIYILDQVEAITKNFVFEINDAQTRLKIWTQVDNMLQKLQSDGGIYDYTVVMDESNNTPEVIDNLFGIIDISIECAKAMEKIHSRLNILKTGAIAAGDL